MDSETSGLDPWAPGSWVTSVGIGTKDYEWCFPLQHPESVRYNKPKLQAKLIGRLDRVLRGKTLVAQNGKFDTKWIAKLYGVWWVINHDTMLLHYQLDENSPHDLTFLSELYYDADPYDIPLKEKHGFGPLDRHCEYLGGDIYYTRKLYFDIRKELKRDKLSWYLYNKLTMPVARMYADVEYHGIYVDPKQLVKQQKYWRHKADRAMKKLTKLCPSDHSWKDKKTKEMRYGVNWASPDQVAEVLFTTKKEGGRGLKSIKETKGGKQSTDESVLLRLGKKDAVPQLILDFRGAEKNLAFVKSWQARAINNRIHPSFLVHGTVTGRPSCKEPNLQQVPRLKAMRKIFTARPGYTLISADFSQVELRLVADASGDLALTFAYQTGVDVHSKTVITIMGIPKPTYEERKSGKAINFGFIYGMWWKTFVDYARDKFGIVFSNAEAKRIRLEFFRLYAGLIPWQKKQKRFAKTHGYVRSVFGRKRRLPDALLNNDSWQLREAENQSVNAPIQSAASDMNLMAAVEIHHTIPRDICHIVSTTHDEILAEVKNSELKKVAQQIKSIMEYPKLRKKMGVEFSVPIIAEVEAGPWGSGVEISGLT